MGCFSNFMSLRTSTFFLTVSPEDGQGRFAANPFFEGITFTGGDRYTLRPDDIGLPHDWD